MTTQQVEIATEVLVSDIQPSTIVAVDDDNWELPGQACTLRPGMPGFEECESCQ
jgi:hypothetical protein